MRGLTSTIVLLLVLGGLVGYVYFADAPSGEAEAKPKAFTVSAENIEEVQIRNADGETSRAQRVDTAWQVVEPVKADADASEVAAITGGLAGLEVQRVVDENPADVKQYGLEPARVEVAFREKDQKDFRRLLIGEKTPAGTDLYAKTPDQNRVFLISSYLESTFNKTAFNLRDKAILKFDREKADTVEIGGKFPAQFTRQGMEWRIAKPIAARADYAAVEGLVTKLSSGQMQEIVASDASNLKQYGLVSPATRVDVGTGSARATLLVGTPNEEGLPFAKDAARPAVFTIDKALLTDLSKPVDEFRRKDVFDFRSFTANRVELRRDSATQTFEKTSTDGKDVWRSGGKDVDSANVEALLTALTNLRAQSFERTAPAALKTPVLTAVVQFDEGRKTETVTFGRAGADTFAARADEPGAARLESGTFDEAIKALDALK
jgi:phage host-nuclease inhibitor protein Gam